MGGKALAHLGAQRLTLEQYYTAMASLQHWADCLHLDKYDAVPEYSGKDSFGDIDVLYCGHPPDFGDRPLVCNGSVRSTLMLTHAGAVQVDFVRCRAELYDFALAYYSYNDLGSLLGRTARYLSFSLGSEGLFYRYKDSKQQVHKVLVTTDWAAALLLIGYKSLAERPTLEQMFSYVQSSKYFCAAPFLLENRNHKARCRDSKRATYNAFLQHLHDNRYSLPEPAADLRKLRAEVFAKALVKFPDFAAKLNDKANELARADQVRAVFNGELVREWTGLQGAALGNLMSELKAEWNWQGLALELNRAGGSGAVKRWVLAVQANCQETST